MGGGLGLKSSPGQGTTFFFRLPDAKPRTSFTVAPQKIILTAEECACITPYLSEFLVTPLYRISRFQQLIDAIDCPESEGINTWKKAVLSACYGEDEEGLLSLLTDVGGSSCPLG